MSSVPESLAPGSTLLHYALTERFSGSLNAWKASDTRNGKPVAIKILTRILPKDKAQREAFLKEMRVNAAMRHPGLAQVLEIDIDRELLFVATELIEGETLRERSRLQPPTRGEFLRLAFQMSEALAHLHSKSLVHGELTSESFVVTPQGDVRLVGIGYASIRKRHETGQALLGAIRPNDAVTPSFLSPEQVIGKPVDARSDIFALGTVFYEMLEGKLPFRGATPADVTQAIAHNAPAAPTAPSVDKTMLSLIGRCLQKNPDKRYQKADELLADLRRVEPNIDRLAARRSAPAPAAAPAPQAASAPSWIVVCELPYHELLKKKDPARAARLETQMQQFLGEAVYLFDGKVLDSLGPRMVADMPDAESALRAARKGLADIVEYNMSNAQEPVEPRSVVHYGELVAVAGKPAGPGLEIAQAVLEAMEPMQTLVSEPVIKALHLASPPAAAGRFRDVNFYAAPSLDTALRTPHAVPPLPPAAPAPATPRPVPVAAPVAPAAVVDEPESEDLEDASSDVPREAPPKKKSNLALIGIIAALFVVGAGAAAVFMLRKGGEPPAPQPSAVATQAAVTSTAPPTPTDTAPRANPSEVFVGEITVEPPAPPATTDTTATAVAPAAPPDPKLVAMANDIRATATAILRLEPTLTLADAAAPTNRQLGGLLRKTDAGLVLVPTITEGGATTEGEPIALPAKAKDNLAPSIELAHWMAAKLGKDATALVSGNPVAAKAFLEAVAQRSAGDSAKAIASAKKSVAADGNFLRAHRFLYELHTETGAIDDAYKDAVVIASLEPANMEIRTQLAKWEAERGQPAKAIEYLGSLMSAKGDDPAVITLVGEYSLSVANEAKFKHAVDKLAVARAVNPRIHEPDVLLARGRVDASVKAYYKVQETQQDNPWLSLKVGRLAVIRRSDTIIQLEHDRQKRLGHPYTLPMMNAFVAAGQGDAATADTEIAKAEAAPERAADHYTLVAEINVLLNRQKLVLEALDRSVARSEPTLTYIVSNPLFGYLQADPRFTKLTRVIREKSGTLSAALDGLAF
ncbi:MAG: protein kinase [Thermoanaerobaculia bacterium]|nr:protein kinase [Thermoanaerobaculia bacterium]